MTLAQPWALVLLLSLPVLLWLHRRRAPSVIRVASVEPYRAAEGAPPPAAARRGVDPVLLLLLASAACLALAASEPAVSRGGVRVRLRIDRSPSMDARLADGSTTVGESALRRARRLVAAALPGAEVEEVDRAGSAGTARDGRPAVLVSDRVPEGGDPAQVVVGPEAPARANVALVGVERSSDGGLTVTAENFGAEPARVRIRGPAGEMRELLVPARSTAAAAFPAIPRGGRDAVRLEPEDGLAADDMISFERRGGAVRVALEGGGPHLAAALRALRIEVAAAPPFDAIVRRGGALEPSAAAPVVHFAPVRAAEGSSIALVEGPGAAGEDVVAHSDFPLPAPSVRFAATSRIRGGEPLLEDVTGALAARAGSTVAFAADPEDESSDWARDGSFPAALGAALDLVTGGPDRIVASPLVPREESDVARAVLPDPPADAIRATAERATPVALGGLLAGAGALAAACAAWLGAARGSGARRPSGRPAAGG